jgi:hypothetical protein
MLNEAVLTIQSGAVLTVEGGLKNGTTGTINNSGTIDLKGDFTNMPGGTWSTANPNTLKFSGAANSNVTSGTAQFQTVAIEKATTYNVTLLDNMTINTQLNFNAAGASKLITGNFDLKIGGTGTVIGYDSDEYVATTGTGGMVKTVTANGAFFFPVGDATNYTPVNNAFTGSAYSSATLRAKANGVVHPNRPSDASDYINRYWDMDATGITGYASTLTGTYVPADVTGTASLIKGAVYNGSAWSYTGADGSANTVIGTTTATTADFTGTNFFGKPQVIAYLRGAYLNGTGGTMTTTLNTSGIIPLTSPYGDGASVGAIPANMTDWVFLELRDPASPTTILGSASAFIKNDGTIVGLDGTSLPRIKNGKPTSIVNIKHRNHLPIRTPDTGIDVANPSSAYNFSTSITQAYDNPAVTTNDAMMLMPDGKYVMWGGNANGNTNVKYTTGSGDEAYLLGTALGGNPTTIISGAMAYNGADMNMNAQIKYTTGSGDEAFLLGTMLGGDPTIIINQHQ